MPKVKSTEEVFDNPGAASAMELMCANFEMSARSIRNAIDQGDRQNLLRALETIRSCAELVKGWVEEGTH